MKYQEICRKKQEIFIVEKGNLDFGYYGSTEFNEYFVNVGSQPLSYT